MRFEDLERLRPCHGQGGVSVNEPVGQVVAAIAAPDERIEHVVASLRVIAADSQVRHGSHRPRVSLLGKRLPERSENDVDHALTHFRGATRYRSRLLGMEKCRSWNIERKRPEASGVDRHVREHMLEADEDAGHRCAQNAVQRSSTGWAAPG